MSAALVAAATTGKSFEQLAAPGADSPYIAYCWASGLIEFGWFVPREAIEIVRGGQAEVKRAMCVAARHGKGAGEGQLLVPGIPEARGQAARAELLHTFLGRCSQTSRPGLNWNVPKDVERRA